MDKVYIIGRDPVPTLVKPEAGETCKLTFAVLPGTSADLTLEVDLDAPGIELDIAGVYIGLSDEKIGIRTLVRHNAGCCTSRQLFKGIVGGRAQALFDGLVYVAKDAQKTKAAQETHSILLTGKAVAEARPQLEIYADDVECSHGATTGFLNPEELFYMRSRGIPEDEARHLQMLAFIAPVLARLPEGPAQEIYDCLS